MLNLLQVLIYDTWGQDIISPLLSVKDLRDCGVTLHMYVHGSPLAEKFHLTMSLLSLSYILTLSTHEFIGTLKSNPKPGKV